MNIQNNNVTIQIHAKDLQGKNLRVADTDLFLIHVFTDNPAFYLTYSGRDMLATEYVDEITIPKRDMEQLRSGVVQYTYHYLPKTESNIPQFPIDEEIDGMEEDVECLHRFPHKHHHPHRPDDFIDDELINSKPVVTSIYWRNLGKPNHIHPENGVNMNDVHRLHRLIDIEVQNRMKDVDNLNKRFDVEFAGKLDVETAERIAEDERLNSLIEALQNKQDEIIDNADKNTEDVENKIEQTSNSIAEETARALKAEAELEVKITKEETARIGADEILDAKIVMEKERATANEQNLADRISSVSEKFESFKSIQTEALQSEINRSKAAESGLNSLVQNVTDNLNAEISRAAQKDIEHQNLVETESNRAQAVENKIATDLETEINRAKDAEKHLLDEVHGLNDTVSNLATATNVYTKSEVDNKINVVKNDVDTVNNWINNHNNDVDALNTKVNSIVADVDKAKSDILAEVAKCDAENDKLSTELKTLSDSVYNKSEVDTKVNDINTAISEIQNWKDNHSDNTDELNSKVAKLIADTEKLSSDVLNEQTERANADLTLSTKLDIVDGKVDAEIERAKASEKLIADEVDELKTSATAKHNELTDSIAETNANLTLEIARAKAAEKVNADAITIINGDVETSGSIKKSLADGKAYTDAEIAKLSLAKDAEIADTLKYYATKTDVDNRISDVIGTAPEALDTLGKISNALAQDSDAITAINDVLVGKANSADVYTKNEVDSTVNTINNTVSSLETKVDNADSTINSRIDDLVAKVNANESSSNTAHDTLQSSIDSEAERAKANEKTISDKVDSEVEKLNEKYNDLNAKVIQDIADSSAKDIELEARITANSEAIATETNRAKQVEKELNDKINSINLDSTNTNLSAEIDRATAAESALQSAIDAEVTRAQAIEQTLTTSISDEIARAKDAEKALSDRIDNIDLTSANNAISALDTKIDNEISRAQNAEKINSDNIASLQTSVSGLNDSVASVNASLTQLQADSVAKDSELENSINVEKNRAEAAEKALSNLIDVINGNVETVGSISHAVEDAKHYVDDKLEGYYDKETFNSIIDGYATKGMVSNVAEEVANVSNQLKNYATKSELEEAIDAIDVTDQLKDYVKSEDNTVITDNNGNVIKSLILDFSDEDDGVVPVYNKNEVDAKFATKAELQEAIDAIELGSKEDVDLSDYYTKDEVENLIDDVDLSNYATKSELNSLGDSITSVSDEIALIQTSVSSKANSADVYDKTYIDGVVSTVNSSLNAKLPIDSFNEWSEGVATKDYVDEKVDSIEIPETDLSDYYTKEQINSNFASKTQVSAKADAINVYSKADTYSKTEINNMFANIIKTYTEEEYENLSDDEKNNGIVIIL